MSWVGVKPDALKRARLVDADMEWPSGLTAGRMLMIWSESQALRLEVVSGSRIWLWANLAGEVDEEKFFRLLCSPEIHFLEKIDGSEENYRIVGNDEALKRIARQTEKSVKGGKARQGLFDDQPVAEPEAQPVASQELDRGSAVGLAEEPALHSRLHLHSRKKSSSNSSDADSPSPKDLVELWNQFKGEKQPKVLASTLKPNTPRWTAAKARLKDYPDLAYWEGVIKRLAASDFCNGKNDRGWVATFPFLLKVETHVKAMEGTYDNKASKKSQPQLKVFSAEDFQ